jgi:hypothetical protein
MSEATKGFCGRLGLLIAVEGMLSFTTDLPQVLAIEWRLLIIVVAGVFWIEWGGRG